MATNSTGLIISLAAVLLVVASAQQQPLLEQQQQPATTIIAAPAPTPPLQNCIISTTKPSPSTTKYTLKQCIVAQFSTYLSLGDNKYIEVVNATVDEKDSHCESKLANGTESDPSITIDFGCGALHFVISKNDSKTFVKDVTASYNINNGTKTVTHLEPMFYTTQTGHYYKCNSVQSIVMGPNVSLVVSNFALEAYRSVSGTDFYQIPDECSLDSQPVSDLVRIGVGICLVALVAIVLVAYFVGRRRWSERSSYESV